VLNRYKEYLDGKSNDWSYAWRVFCLFRWLEAHGVLQKEAV